MAVSGVDYGTSRGVGKFVAGIGWVLLALGGVVLLISLATLSRSAMGIMGLIPAILIGVAGLMFIVQGQVLQATVDTASACNAAANHLRELLRLTSTSTKPPTGAT
jgi:hypothetical protein